MEKYIFHLRVKVAAKDEFDAKLSLLYLKKVILSVPGVEVLG